MEQTVHSIDSEDTQTSGVTEVAGVRVKVSKSDLDAT